MQILNAKQGTPEWLAHRLKHRNASDAPAIMGCSKYKTRSQAIREAATGLAENITPETQRLFDSGHAYESLARPGAEEIVGEDLYPVTGYEGSLSASFDGLTLDDRIAWEHKSLNDDLRAVLPTKGVGDERIGAMLPLMYRVQMEQQALISGCERVLFTASKWNGEACVDSRHCWYLPDPELRAQIVAGWAQFEADVAAYQPAEVAPVVVAEPVQALPAVMVKVDGQIAITANFTAFETAFRRFISDRLITDPSTDQDFADLDLQIKAMKGAEAALDAAEAQMLAQISSVDTAKKTKDMLAALVRQHRLASEKLLASEKERRKAEIVAAGHAALREHVKALTNRVAAQITVTENFAGAIKGKKSLASMEDAIATELARAKIEASRVADLIDANRAAMGAADAAGLFPDFASVCTKSAEDFANLVTSRKAAAEAAQAARLEAERVRIRAEEAARMEREQREAQARADAEAHARNQAAAETARAPHAVRPAPPAPAPEVRAFVPRAAVSAAAGEEPTLTLGRISGALGITVTADLLARLGFAAHVVKAARLYRPSDFPAIKRALIEHIQAVPDAVPLAA